MKIKQTSASTTNTERARHVDFSTVRAQIGGLKGLLTKLGDHPPEHKWNAFPACPFCGHKDSSGVFQGEEGTEFFKCHHPHCSSGGRCVTEIGYLNLRLGLSEQRPAAGGPSPAYLHLLKLAGCYEEAPPPSTPADSKPSETPPKVPPTSGPESKPEGKPALPPGYAALRWFYEQLSPTTTQMQACLPDGQPVPDPLPDHLVRQLQFQPVSLLEKRGLTAETCAALGLRANPRANEAFLRELGNRFGWEEKVASGLWLEADIKRHLERRPNTQFHGKGQVGKKPEPSRRNEDDKWQWGWGEPVLIPYFDEHGQLVKLRPHKGGAPGGTVAGAEKIYVPRDHRVTSAEEKFSTVIICEGEFKAAVLWQEIGAGSALNHGDTQEPVGVCALPGISFTRNLKYRADLEEWLRNVGCRKVIVAFDDEDKRHKPLHQRFDAVKYARYLALDLASKLKLTGLYLKLPEEWRVNGKADWDGAMTVLRGDGMDSKQSHSRIRAAFESVLDSALAPERTGRSGLFTDEEELHIQREVTRLLWKPKLPNAGDEEREWLRTLRELSRDESLVVELKACAGRYADALEKCLPMQECVFQDGKWLTLPGCYYSRRPITPKTNKSLFNAAVELKREAAAKKDAVKKWFAQFVLDGMPQAVSNFNMECLYLLRGADGSVTRLVRFMNTKGEVSQGHEIGGADMLPNEFYAGSEKFRQLVQSKGNFTWGGEGGAGNTELQLLQWDVTETAAYREVKLIQYCGWHEIKSAVKRPPATGRERLHGLWFFDECAITPDNGFLLPDDDGIYWFEGQGYALSRKGRELDFIQGRPRLRPELSLSQVQFDISDWEQPRSDQDLQPAAAELYVINPLGAFFREMGRRLCETAGGLEGWLSLGAVLGYAAAPEIYAIHKNFPSVWVSGQMGSGKSTFVSWLMSIQGFSVPMGMGLISKSVSPVGIACQLENYSNLILWLDEFRQHQIAEDKEPMLRDSYGRQLAGKWTPDGIQRVIRTMTLVSGESTTSDAATRSRYPHVLLSEQKRQANHYEWMRDHQEFFVFFWREVLLRRKEFVALVLDEMDSWTKELKHVASREKTTYSVCYAAFVAAARLFGSHSEEELKAYRRFLAVHAGLAAEDVASDTNINVLFQELVIAYVAGAIPNDCFRVEGERVEEPGRGWWMRYRLYIEPHLAISALQIYLRKGNQRVTLRLKDLRDQLSRHDFWIKPGKDSNYALNKRFGRKGSTVSKAAWGIYVDLHPLGTRKVSDADYDNSLVPEAERKLGIIGPQFKDGDPRKGPLFSIIEGVLAWESEQAND